MFENPKIIDFNVADQIGDTPLHRACYNGHFEVVKFLLENSNEKEIDIYKKNNNQRTAEDLARLKGHKDILELLEIWTLSKRLETLRKKYHSEARKAKFEEDKARLKELKRKHEYSPKDSMNKKRRN